MTIYMQVTGIQGDVSAEQHTQWIELESLCFGVQRSITTLPGRTYDREAARPSVSDMTVVKRLDKASPLLFSEACVGKTKTVVIHVCQTGSDSHSPFMAYILNHVVFSGYSVQLRPSATSPEQLIAMEQLQLNFDKLEMRYTPYDKDNNPEAPIPAGYDLATAQKI